MVWRYVDGGWGLAMRHPRRYMVWYVIGAVNPAWVVLM